MNKLSKITGIIIIVLLLSGTLSISSSADQTPDRSLIGSTERASISSEGMQTNDWSGNGITISGDGRYVAFDSNASNLVIGDTNYFCETDYDMIPDDNCADIFVHDRETGETRRVSVSSDGTQADYSSEAPSISSNGRYIVFTSGASDLVAGDTNLCGIPGNFYNCPDVFVHDMQTGETTRVSIASDGTQGNDYSIAYSISADGRYVIFGSQATNLVEGDTNNVEDIFVHDRLTGTTTCVSVASNGYLANSWSIGASISNDGNYVAYQSAATNLVDNDTNNKYDIFVHNIGTGETTRVSLASDGTQANKDSYPSSSYISQDGRYVAFSSYANNLVISDTNDLEDIFVHDQITGETIRVSVASDGTQADNWSSTASISSDGHYVVFSSWASNLVIEDTNNTSDIFAHDLLTGETTLVSLANDGTQGNEKSISSETSDDGRYVGFVSLASNLVIGDTNNYCNTDFDGDFNDNCPDIFMRDRESLVNTYAISGQVTDSEWNPLSGVNISAGYGHDTVTDALGNYTLPELQSGTYKITAYLDGYDLRPSYREASVPPGRVGVDFTEIHPVFLPVIKR